MKKGKNRPKPWVFTIVTDPTPKMPSLISGDGVVYKEPGRFHAKGKPPWAIMFVGVQE
jgi:hypothetical protein